MSQREADKRPRFPLSLDQTAPTLRRLVKAPHERDTAPLAEPLGVNVARPAVTLAPPRQVAPKVMPVAAATTAEMPALAVPNDAWGSGTARLRLAERLWSDGCRDEAVLRAFMAVPRHVFVDAALAPQAYEDTSLPIGLGQTISKPSVVARMIELLRARPGGPTLNRVLEIGTGCGYQATLLALLARQVYTIERLRGLYDKARENLAPLRPDNLRLVYGDGRLGHGPNAPYDGIIAAAGGHDIPAAWLDQLAPGGRLVAPVHDSERGAQALVVIDRLADGRLQRSEHETVRFVPLESGVDSNRR